MSQTKRPDLNPSGSEGYLRTGLILIAGLIAFAAFVPVYDCPDCALPIRDLARIGKSLQLDAASAALLRETVTCTFCGNRRRVTVRKFWSWNPYRGSSVW